MTDYLMIFRGGAPSPDLSAEEKQEHMAKWGAWIQTMSEAGKFKAGDPLESEGKVLRGADKVVSDGPYAEAKDVVGGYVIVSAENEDEALTLAKGCPIFADGGSLELRALASMEM